MSVQTSQTILLTLDWDCKCRNTALMTSPWSMPVVPWGYKVLTTAPTSAGVTDINPNALNPSSKSTCGAGAAVALFGLVGAAGWRLRKRTTGTRSLGEKARLTGLTDRQNEHPPILQPGACYFPIMSLNLSRRCSRASASMGLSR